MSDSTESQVNGDKGKKSSQSKKDSKEAEELQPPPPKSKNGDAIVEDDTEEAGYKSDKSASDEGSTDAVVDRRREKGSSGYEESGEEEEGVSEISEGLRERGEQEEDEYDKEAIADASSDDDISEEVDEEGSEGYEEDTEEEDEESKAEEQQEDQAEEYHDDEEKEDVNSPSFVPKRTVFWGHDDRYENIRIEESRRARGGKQRQLWDKTSERWEHDMFKEEEQGPKEPWEIEESLRDADRRPQRGRNRQRLGDFIGNRGKSGRGRSTRERREDEVNRNQQEDSSEFEDRRSEKRSHERGRGRPRGRGRGRGGFKKDTRHEWNKENEWGGRRSGVTRKTKEYSWQADGNEAKDVGKQDILDWGDEGTTKEISRGDVEDKRTEGTRDGRKGVDLERRKDETEGKRKEYNGERPSEKKKESVKKDTPPQSKQRPNKTEKEEGHVSKGRGKGVMSDKVTSSKKTAVEFNKEKKKKTEKEIKEDEDRFEDAENPRDPVTAEDREAKKGLSAAKPKRYSSQRHRVNVADEQQLADQENESATIQEGQYYNQFPQQDMQAGMFNPNAMAFMQYQMQQMQLQMQALRQQQTQTQQQPQQPAQPQQIPMQPGQAPQIMTPAMQQYMQEQFLLQLQALQRSQMQQQQQHQERQQQQQMQQQQLQEMRAIQEIMDESGQQKGSPDQAMMIQSNVYSTMPANIQPYGIAAQPPGIYTQAGSQYEVPFDQLMTARQQSGLFIPSMHQLPPQQVQMQDVQRKARSAAIPIKPPPDQQET